MWLTFAFISAILLGMYEVFKKMALDGNAVIPVLFLNRLLQFIVSPGYPAIKVLSGYDV